MKDLIRFLRIHIIRFLALLRSKRLRNKGTILIIAPHPDDEVIGCAGLIQQSLNQGINLVICILTGGEASHQTCCKIAPQTVKAARHELAQKIDTQLGVPLSNLYFLNFTDGKISKDSTEVEQLKSIIKKTKPDSIYIPHQKGEGWSDHIEAGNIIKELCRNNSASIYEYCVWFWYYNVWSLDLKNAYILQMTSKEHQNKLQAIHDYITPLAPCGKPYSGVLPKVFIWGNQWKNELYFKVR